jgi:hypothetical protein
MKYAPLLLLLIACSNSATNDTKQKQSRISSSSGQTANTTDDCSSFFWFKKGTVAKFNETDASGKNYGTTTMAVTDVHNEGNALVARMMSESGATKISGKYKCEDGKVMMELGSVFQSISSNGMHMELSSEGWIEFPLNLETGDSLNGTPYEMKAVKDGRTFMTMKSEVTSRSVGEKKRSLHRREVGRASQLLKKEVWPWKCLLCKAGNCLRSRCS